MASILRYPPFTTCLCCSSRGIGFCDGLACDIAAADLELLRHVEFRRDFATCEIRQGPDSPHIWLAKFSGELYLEFYRYEIFKA